MATKSIGLTGRDYSTLSAWASYVNALSLSAPEVGEVYTDSGAVADTTAVSIGGYTGSSSTNTVTLKAAASNSFYDNANKLTNALRYNASNGAALTNSVGYADAYTINGANFFIDGLQFRSSSGVASKCLVGKAAKITRTIIQHQGSSAALTTEFEVENVAIVTKGSASQGMFMIGTGPKATDVTVVASTASSNTGIGQSYSSGALVKNCAVAGFTTDYSGTVSASSTNNATDKGSFGGTNYGGSGQTSLVATTEWENVTSGSEDLRIKSTSAKLKDNGATTGPAYDIVNTTRSAPYDIGAWEYSSGVSDTFMGQACL